MDNLGKALRKFSSKERQLIKELLLRIKEKKFFSLNIEKLKGYENVFRVRKERIRIIYLIDKEELIKILKIDRRSEKTYKL